MKKNLPDLKNKAHHIILAIGACLLLCLGTLQFIELRRSWHLAVQTTEQQAVNIASIAAQEMARTFQGIRLAFAGIADLLELHPDTPFDDPRLRRMFDEKIADLPHVRRLILIDRNGWDSTPLSRTGGRVNVADRDYFIEHRDQRGLALRIGVPTTSRVLNRMTVPVSRRIDDAEGRFAGVLLALLDPSAIDDIYRAVDLGDDGVMSLFRSDGIRLGRSPYDESLLGKSGIDTAVYRAWTTQGESGAVMGTGGIDDVMRIVGYSRVADLPLVMTVGLDADIARGQWFRRVGVEIATIMAFTISIGLATILLAVAARRQALLLDRLQYDQQRFRDFAEIASDWLCELDRDLRFSYVSPRREEITGAKPETIIGLTPFEAARREDMALQREAYESHRFDLEGHREFRNFEFWMSLADGSRRYVSISGRPVIDPDGRFAGYRGAVTDRTAHRAAEDRAQQSSVRLLDAIGRLADGFALFDSEDRLVLWNDAFADLAASAAPLTAGLPFSGFARQVAQQVVLPDPLGADVETWIAERTRRHRAPSDPILIQIRDGRWVRIAETRTKEGGVAGLYIDETARRRMEDALAQTQRLDAIGQLTGGIAHDFNNLLTVIQLQGGALLAAAKGDTETSAMANDLLYAAQRGAALTQQLLAFARRQHLRPTTIDVNELLRTIGPLLRRTLSAAIEMRFELADDLPPILADRTQFETAILNLAINARDAMPRGGMLTIVTRRVAPGTGVAIEVSDTGHGMTLEVQQRIFEPFFTTKPRGQGTGLGLSMVHGFVNQSGGTIDVESAVGKGTTVRIRLPPGASASPDAPAAQVETPSVAGKGECILVVEDDRALRAAVTAQLRAVGYVVVDAPDGPAGLAILRDRGDIDLLFTDMVMPGGMTGQDLANAARRLHTALKVLVTSGYTDDQIIDADLLPKPYAIAELAGRIRALLDTT